MRLAPCLITLGIVLAAAASSIDDEFSTGNDVSGTVGVASEKTVLANSLTPTPAAVLHSAPRLSFAERARAHNWTMEAVAVTLIVLYVAWYLRGSRQNASTAACVGSLLAPILAEQFSSVGVGSEGDSIAPWTKVSDSEYESWCSGRRNCSGARLVLSLAPRQDAIVSLVGRFVPALASVAKQSDTLSVEVPLGEATTGAAAFVLGVSRSAQRKAFVAANGDLGRYAAKVVSGLSRDLPPSFEIVGEHGDMVNLLSGGGSLFPRLLGSSEGVARTLRSVHLTTDAQLSTELQRTAALSKRVAHFTFAVPPADSLEADLRPWLVFVFAVVDSLPTLVLPKGASDAAVAARAAHAAELEKKAAAEAAAKAREAQAAEKKRLRAEMIAALSPEARQKLEKKERAERTAAMLKPRMKKM